MSGDFAQNAFLRLPDEAEKHLQTFNQWRYNFTCTRGLMGTRRKREVQRSDKVINYPGPSDALALLPIWH